MKNLSDIISENKKKEFDVIVNIQLENTIMKSIININETTSSFAKEAVTKILNENNITKFEINDINEVESEDFPIAEDDVHTRDEGGRYLSIHIQENSMVLKLTPDGRIIAETMKAENKSDLDIMYELFEDIQTNSEFIWHSDLGDSEFGLTSAPGITSGYYYHGERGEMYKTDHEDPQVYYFDEYALRSEIDDLITNELILTKIN